MLLGQKQTGLRYLTFYQSSEGSAGADCCLSRNGFCQDPEPASLGTNYFSTGKKLLNSIESFPSFGMQGLEELSFSWLGEEVRHAYERQAKSVSASCYQ